MAKPVDRLEGRNKTKLMASGVGAGMFNYVIADHTSMGHDDKLSFGYEVSSFVANCLISPKQCPALQQFPSAPGNSRIRSCAMSNVPS